MILIRKFFRKQAASLGRGAIRHVFATITADAQIALFGVAHESLEQAQA